MALEHDVDGGRRVQLGRGPQDPDPRTDPAFLKEAGRGDIKVTAAALIPSRQDYDYLREAGVVARGFAVRAGQCFVECVAEYGLSTDYPPFVEKLQVCCCFGHNMPPLGEGLDEPCGVIYSILLFVRLQPAEGIQRGLGGNPPDCGRAYRANLTHCALMGYREAVRQWLPHSNRAKQGCERVAGNYPPNAAIASDSHAAALAAGQRAWLEFRIQHCRLYLVGGGSMAPMLEGICLRDITRERTNALAAMALNPATGNPYFEE